MLPICAQQRNCHWRKEARKQGRKEGRKQGRKEGRKRGEGVKRTDGDEQK